MSQPDLLALAGEEAREPLTQLSFPDYTPAFMIANA